MKRVILAVFALVVLVAAASPSEVAPVLEAQGFFVEAGSDADPDAVEDAVVAARFEGGALSIAVLASEAAGGPTIFAENTLDEMGGRGTVFIVGPENVGWARHMRDACAFLSCASVEAMMTERYCEPIS